MRSSAASIPTESRTSASSTSSLRAGDGQVGHHGRQLDQRLDAAERLGQREEPRRLADRDRALARRPAAAGRRDERDHAAAGTHLAGRDGGVRGGRAARRRGPGTGPRRRRRDRRGTRATAAALAACRSTRRWSVRSPRRTRKQSSGPGTPPIAFWRNRSRSAIASSFVTATPRIVSRVAGEVLRRRVEDDVGAERRAGAGAPATRTCCRRR